MNAMRPDLPVAQRFRGLSLVEQEMLDRADDFQLVRRKLAEMSVAVESMRLFTDQSLRAANPLETGRGPRRDPKITAASVLLAADTLNRVLDDAVQIHGGSSDIWGLGDQPALAHDQAARDRGRHDRGAQDHHQRRAAARLSRRPGRA